MRQSNKGTAAVSVTLGTAVGPCSILVNSAFHVTVHIVFGQRHVAGCVAVALGRCESVTLTHDHAVVAAVAVAVVAAAVPKVAVAKLHQRNCYLPPQIDCIQL